MQPRPLSIDKPSQSKDGLRAGLRSLWRSLLHMGRRREAVHHLPPHLLRDIGLNERYVPDWERDPR